MRDLLPEEVVASQYVGNGDRYTFDVAPGRYVLYAPVPPAGSPTNAFRYTTVVLNKGDNVTVDIPNACI